MPFCPNCGAQVNEGAKFCPGCGKPLQGDAPAPAASAPTPNNPNLIDCPCCGARVSKFAKACPQCGGPLDGSENMAQFKTPHYRNGYGADFRLRVVNAQTGEVLYEDYGGKVIKLKAPVEIRLDHAGLKKLTFTLQPGKKYQGKILAKLLGITWTCTEVDVFDGSDD